MEHCSQFRHNFFTMWTRNIILILLCYPNQTESAAHAKLNITGYNRLPYGLTYCEKDTDCDENEFCRFYADLSYCHICIDCYGYYRRKVPEGGCAKNRSLCSDCIPGYRIIQGECVKVGSSTPLLSTSTSSPGDLANPETMKIILSCVGLGTFLLVCACVGLFCCWKKNKKRGKLENHPTYENKDENDYVPVMVKENEPPTISPHNTDLSAPLLIDLKPQTDNLLNDQREIEHESLSQTVVFNRPIYENPQLRNFTQNNDLPLPRNPSTAVDNNGRRIQVWNQPNYHEDRAIRPRPNANLAPQEPLQEGGPLYPDPVSRRVGMSVNRDPTSRMDPEAEHRVVSMPDPMPNPRANPRVDPRTDPRADPRMDPMPNPVPNPWADPRLDPMPNTMLDSMQNPWLDPLQNPRLDPMPNPRLDPMQNSRLDPLQNPRLDPMPNPRLDLMPNPRLDLRADPSATPRADPRPEPMPDPETDPRPSARSHSGRGIIDFNCRLEFQF